MTGGGAGTVPADFEGYDDVRKAAAVECPRPAGLLAISGRDALTLPPGRAHERRPVPGAGRALLCGSPDRPGTDGERHGGAPPPGRLPPRRRARGRGEPGGAPRSVDLHRGRPGRGSFAGRSVAGGARAGGARGLCAACSTRRSARPSGRRSRRAATCRSRAPIGDVTLFGGTWLGVRGVRLLGPERGDWFDRGPPRGRRSSVPGRGGAAGAPHRGGAAALRHRHDHRHDPARGGHRGARDQHDQGLLRRPGNRRPHPPPRARTRRAAAVGLEADGPWTVTAGAGLFADGREVGAVTSAGVVARRSVGRWRWRCVHRDAQRAGDGRRRRRAVRPARDGARAAAPAAAPRPSDHVTARLDRAGRPTQTCTTSRVESRPHDRSDGPSGPSTVSAADAAVRAAPRPPAGTRASPARRAAPSASPVRAAAAARPRTCTRRSAGPRSARGRRGWSRGRAARSWPRRRAPRRARAPGTASSVSPGSHLPPGNSHVPARCVPSRRRVTRKQSSRSTTAAVTTIVGRVMSVRLRLSRRATRRRRRARGLARSRERAGEAPRACAPCRPSRRGPSAPG